MARQPPLTKQETFELLSFQLPKSNFDYKSTAGTAASRSIYQCQPPPPPRLRVPRPSFVKPLPPPPTPKTPFHSPITNKPQNPVLFLQHLIINMQQMTLHPQGYPPLVNTFSVPSTASNVSSH